MENIHVTEVALKSLEEARMKITEASLSQKPITKATEEVINGYIGYAYEFIEKILKKGVKTA
jgi:hypothetical protein